MNSWSRKLKSRQDFETQRGYPDMIRIWGAQAGGTKHQPKNSFWHKNGPKKNFSTTYIPTNYVVNIRTIWKSALTRHISCNDFGYSTILKLITLLGFDFARSCLLQFLYFLSYLRAKKQPRISWQSTKTCQDRFSAIWKMNFLIVCYDLAFARKYLSRVSEVPDFVWKLSRVTQSGMKIFENAQGFCYGTIP